MSLAIVPVGGLTCPVEPARAARAPRTMPATLPRTAGPWAHFDPPVVLPKWITCEGFSGLLAYNVPAAAADLPAHTRLVMRAVAFPELPNPTWAVVLDIPLSQVVEQRITDETGIRIGEVTALPFGSRENVVPVTGRALEPIASDPLGREQTLSLTTQRWVAFLDYTDWTTGTPSGATLAMRINAWAIYDRLSAASASVGEMNFGQLLLAVLALVGGPLPRHPVRGARHRPAARPPDHRCGPRSVHRHQHLRNRDFVHTIPVRARDQLGELAESFNVMTGEVRTLLGEVAEKGRMEQEMHAARDIQQKLLPPAPRNIPGLSLAAFCEPAREVAGDYYDFLPITDTMIGVLIADVAGKGLAAGLYMAQLKVIVQSLARLHHEPREFLIAVNGVVGAEPRRQELHHHDLRRDRPGAARDDVRPRRALPVDPRPGLEPAGLRHAADAGAGRPGGRAQDRRGQMFESMLEERTVPLAAGDLIVLFTDGISETMNEAFDCFGEARLAKVIEQYAHLPFDQLRSYILAELRAFAGCRRAARRHDHDPDEGGMNTLVTIFRTRSEIEANVVQALLDSHGVESVADPGAPPGMFPFTVSTLGETRGVGARRGCRRGGAHHRDPPRAGAGRAGGAAAAAVRCARGAARLSLPRSRAAGARADPQVEGARGPERRRRRQRVARVPRRRGARSGRGRRAVPRLPDLLRRAEVEDQGEPGVDGVARGDCRALGLGDHMILGRGEEKTGGRRKQALLADTCEAIIAALYLDGGLEAARRFIVREIGRAHRGGAAAQLLRPRPQVAPAGAAAEPGPLAAGLPRAVETGPEHRKVFSVQVVDRRALLRSGEGRTKKDAEQEAARLALESLDLDPDWTDAASRSRLLTPCPTAAVHDCTRARDPCTVPARLHSCTAPAPCT